MQGFLEKREGESKEVNPPLHSFSTIFKRKEGGKGIDDFLNAVGKKKRMNLMGDQEGEKEGREVLFLYNIVFFARRREKS